MKALKYPLVILLITPLIYLYYIQSIRAGANSDNISSLLMALDFANGNIRMADWFMSTQSYIFSDMIWTAMAIKLFGYSINVAHYVPAFFYFMCLICSFVIVNGNRTTGLLILLPIVVFPSYFSTLNSIELNIHIGIYLFSLLCLVYLTTRENKLSWIECAFLSVFFGFLADSDKLIVFIFILPVIISSAYHFIIERNRHYLKILSFAVISVFFFKVAGFVNSRVFDYVTPGYGSAGFANLSQLKHNFSLFFEGLSLYLFSNEGALGEKGKLIVFLLAAFYIIFFLVISFFYARKTFTDTVLFFSVVIPVLAFLLSTIPQDVGSSRFFYFSFLSSAIFIARNLKVSKAAILISPLLISWAALNTSQFLHLNETDENKMRHISNVLNSKGLKVGYSEFWKSAITTAHGEINVFPLASEHIFAQKIWLSKSSWYKRGGNFLLSNDNAEMNRAIMQYGKPQEKFDIDGYSVMVWDRMPVSPYGFSLHDMRLIPSVPDAKYLQDGSVQSKGEPGFIIYGQYIPVYAGKYQLNVVGSDAKEGDFVDIYDSIKNEVVYKSVIKFDSNGVFQHEVELKKNLERAEIRVYSVKGSKINIKSYTLIFNN